jgi:uncharacterized protein YbdZ (MbtH family)
MRALGCIAQPFDEDFGHFVVVLNDQDPVSLVDFELLHIARGFGSFGEAGQLW